jgi:hypothetical protein
MARRKGGNRRRNGEQWLEEMVSNVKQWLEGRENNGKPCFEKVRAGLVFWFWVLPFFSKAGFENEISRWTKKFWEDPKKIGERGLKMKFGSTEKKFGRSKKN